MTVETSKKIVFAELMIAILAVSLMIANFSGWSRGYHEGSNDCREHYKQRLTPNQ